jgi:signal transduction histidine kinase
MRVGEILDRKGRHLYEVSPDWPVRRAVALLATWRVGTTLVTDFEGGLLGIISERDVIRAFNEFGGSTLQIRVRDLMTQSVITCTPETTIPEALSLMAAHRIRHLPVVQGAKILGLISIRDVLEFRLASLEEHFVALTRAEQESARAREEAERARGEAERARGEAELASRVKTEFLANMSHELRTPLNAVIGFSEIIVGEHFGPDATELYRQYVGHINTSGRHLLNLVNEVLDLSKVVSGQLELQESPVDLGALLRECADLLAVQIAERQLTLHTTVPEELPCLSADALRLKQALLNLLSNAIKFSHVGGVVEVRALITGDSDLTIAITDCGIGMRPADIPIAFEPFRQIDGDAAHAREGTGLGLPLAKMLVEKHGGTLTVTSALGEGTTVDVAIPGWRINWAGASEAFELA